MVCRVCGLRCANVSVLLGRRGHTRCCVERSGGAVAMMMLVLVKRTSCAHACTPANFADSKTGTTRLRRLTRQRRCVRTCSSVHVCACCTHARAVHHTHTHTHRGSLPNHCLSHYSFRPMHRHGFFVHVRCVLRVNTTCTHDDGVRNRRLINPNTIIVIASIERPRSVTRPAESPPPRRHRFSGTRATHT